MTAPLSEDLLARFSTFIVSQMGLHFPTERRRDLERALTTLANTLGDTTPEACAERLMAAGLSKSESDVLASHLTVGETYFFRDKRVFEILREHIQQDWAGVAPKHRRRLRIWSAGCCTGEEPYSIAILLDRLSPGVSRKDVTILATDINPHFLRKAEHGVFTEWAFRDAPPWLKEKYFTPAGAGRYEIQPRIRDLVSYAYLNLAKDAFPSLLSNTTGMDVIFCRNVLMYFTPALARQVIDQLGRALAPSGWLVVGPAEVSGDQFSVFEPERYEGGILYRKGSGAPPLPAIAPVPEPPAVVFGPPQTAVAVERNTSSVPELVSAVSLAQDCANAGDLRQARLWAEKAINENKLDPALHYLRATILQEQGLLDESATSLKRALYLDPNFVLAHFSLAEYAWKKGWLKEAGKHFGTALALLRNYKPDEILPYSDGFAAGRLRELIEMKMAGERSAS